MKPYENIKLNVKGRYVDKYRILWYYNGGAQITSNSAIEIRGQEQTNNYNY